MTEKIKKYFSNLREVLLMLLVLGVASYFTYLCASQFDHPGDQQWFADIIKQFDYRYFEFAVYRYQTWSSRLLLEAAMAFFSVHQVGFLVAVFISSTSLLAAFIHRFRQRSQTSFLVFGIPLLFLVFFQIRLFTSAGVIATVTNYFFPMVAFALAFFLKDQSSRWLQWLSVICLFLVVMHEQFALLTLLLTVYLIIIHRKRTLVDGGFLLIAAAGIVSILLCPGNAIRKASEITQFFPDFEEVGLFKRIVLTFLDTSNQLFAGRYWFVLFFLSLLVLLAFLKKQYLALAAAGIPLVLILANLGRILGFQLLANLSAQLASPSRTIRYLLLYLLLYALIALAVFLVFNDRKRGMDSVYLILIGFAARMALAMSPTMFASENRTLVPFVFMLFVVAVSIVEEMTTISWLNGKTY